MQMFKRFHIFCDASNFLLNMKCYRFWMAKGQKRKKMFAHADLMQIQWHSFKNLSRIILKRVFMLNEIICLRDKKRTVAKLCMYLYIITMVKISFLDCQNEFNILLCAPPFVSQIIICIELELPYDDCVNIWVTCYLDTTNYQEHIYFLNEGQYVWIWIKLKLSW